MTGHKSFWETCEETLANGSNHTSTAHIRLTAFVHDFNVQPIQINWAVVDASCPRVHLHRPLHTKAFIRRFKLSLVERMWNGMWHISSTISGTGALC